MVSNGPVTPKLVKMGLSANVVVKIRAQSDIYIEERYEEDQAPGLPKHGMPY